ncbi:MAG: A/G-specific adenine glycosylase [Fibrobacter sp.]|nr:A/G-specific adenine glycosylase [Fibrobacter sp.]
MDVTTLKKLRDWFRKNAAELPWRPADLDAPRDPYAVWISETMLQQTQVATVREYFIRWMKRFPDIETLAKASEEEVFKYWQGLGYYSRARNILKTAKAVTLEERSSDRVHKKTLPVTRRELEALPGIGAYTAGAILSLAHHQREAILDGNLVRIFSRLYALDFLPTDKLEKRRCPTKSGMTTNKQIQSASEIYWNYAREVADSPKAYMHNEALMELGRTVCKVKNPDCANCPLRNACRAALENRTDEFPPSKKHLQKDWHGTVLIVESTDHKILAVHGGQKFFKNQFTLPHFESPRNATAGLPAQTERYIDADKVLSVENIGKFRHSITVHKMECDVLYIRLNGKAPAPASSEIKWVRRESARDFFASSFCLKALKFV